MKPLRIYIAGPYTPKNCSLHDAARIAQHNVDVAVDIANLLIDKGHIVFVPHLSHYMHIRRSTCGDRVPWYDIDNTFIDYWANALFYISSSEGADEELERATRLGLRIFVNIGDVPNVKDKTD